MNERADRDAELDKTLGLLRSVFPSVRFHTPDFVDWVYYHNPDGPVLEENIDDRDTGERIAHIAGVPRYCRNHDTREIFAMMYNVATSPTSQRKGLYVKLCFNLISRTAGELGGFIGVANDNSVSPDVNTLGTKLIGFLPALLVPPTRLRTGHVFSRVADSAFLDSDQFVTLFADADDVPAENWVHCWSLDVLRWRLRWPQNTYAVHATNDLVAISTLGKKRGARVAVICKLLPRHGMAGPLDPSTVISAACKFHRAPVALYVGWNAHVPVKGFRLKKEWLPSPLALVFLANSEKVDQDSFTFDTFEFLDFDAF